MGAQGTGGPFYPQMRDYVERSRQSLLTPLCKSACGKCISEGTERIYPYAYPQSAQPWTSLSSNEQVNLSSAEP